MAQQQWLTAKARQILQRNSVSWQTSCMQQHQLERCPRSLTRKLFKANWDICDQTETNLDNENAIEFWSEQMAIYKLIGPLILDLLSATASQAFVERIFSLCVVWWLQGEEIRCKHPFRCVHFWNWTRDCLSDNNRQLWSCVMTRTN